MDGQEPTNLNVSRKIAFKSMVGKYLKLLINVY